MSSLTTKRIIVWVVSALLGILTAYLIISVGFGLLPLISIPPIITPVQAEGIGIDKYGIIYFITTAFPLALIYVVWLDYFLGTKILPGLRSKYKHLLEESSSPSYGGLFQSSQFPLSKCANPDTPVSPLTRIRASSRRSLVA